MELSGGTGQLPGRPAPASGEVRLSAVGEVPLNRDLAPAKEPSSYAIVMPGLVNWSWADVIGLRKYGDLRFFAKPEFVPDLPEQLTWVRTPCGGDAGRR